MEKYKGSGFRLTPQRLAIIKYLESSKTHPSAEEVHTAVLEDFPMISFATVYNTLNMLKEKGEVVELSIDPERKRYDANLSAHHHLICLSCKSILDIYKDFLLDLSEQDKHVFNVIESRVSFYGYCSECSNSVKR